MKARLCDLEGVSISRGRCDVRCGGGENRWGCEKRSVYDFSVSEITGEMDVQITELMNMCVCM